MRRVQFSRRSFGTCIREDPVALVIRLLAAEGVDLHARDNKTWLLLFERKYEASFSSINVSTVR